MMSALGSTRVGQVDAGTIVPPSRPRSTSALLHGLLVVLLSAPSTGCGKAPATEIMLRVDSDVGADLRAVHVLVDRGTATATIHDVTYNVASGQYRLPGTLGIVPARVDDTRPLRVEVGAEFDDPARNFSQRAVVHFRPGHTLLLNMFLARECETASVRMACENRGQTCGAGGQCVEVERPGLPDLDDSGVDAGGDDGDVDATLSDAGQDAAIDDARPPLDAGPRALHGGVTTVGGSTRAGSGRLTHLGLEFGGRSCVRTRCLSGGLVP